MVSVSPSAVDERRVAMDEYLAWKKTSWKLWLGTIFALPLIAQYYLSYAWYFYPITMLAINVPLFAVVMFAWNYLSVSKQNRSRLDDFVEIKDENLKSKYKGGFIPVQVLYESYADDKLEFKKDVLAALESRDEYSTNRLMWWHIKFFFCTFLPELLHHTKVQDIEQVRDHYDRGDDFYEAFLGPMMIYTSGIMQHSDDSLEEMQLTKLERICQKLQLKQSDKMLDIGCGWGTLVNHAVETHDVQGCGLTLSRNQVKWAEGVAKEKGIQDGVTFICSDYRDLKSVKYSKISCLEMAEHVGIKNFGSFMSQVYDMLEDDGIFFLQIAGLRRAWQWEDFIWGLFMDKYIFPGADASCPLAFVISHLEAAGFEIQSTDTIGIHYSHTINRWYKNWIRPEIKSRMIAKYGLRLYRIWEVFLAWSTIVARQGNSTCFQIVAHKNLNGYNRGRFIKATKTNSVK
eukprot:gene6129-6834_t